MFSHEVTEPHWRARFQFTCANIHANVQLSLLQVFKDTTKKTKKKRNIAKLHSGDICGRTSLNIAVGRRNLAYFDRGCLFLMPEGQAKVENTPNISKEPTGAMEKTRRKRRSRRRSRGRRRKRRKRRRKVEEEQNTKKSRIERAKEQKSRKMSGIKCRENVRKIQKN